MEAIHEQEAYAEPEMEDGVAYLYENVQRKLSKNLSVHMSDLDFDAFELDDIDELAKRYRDNDERRYRTTAQTASQLSHMKPIPTPAAYC